MFDRYEGAVKMYNREKGFGFVSRDNGDELFVHASEVGGISYLRKGDRVEFYARMDAQRRLRATGITVTATNGYTRISVVGNTPPAPMDGVFKHITANPHHVGRDFVRHVAWLNGRSSTLSLYFLREEALTPRNPKEFSTSNIPWGEFVDNLRYSCKVNPWWVEQVRVAGLEGIVA